MIHAWLDSTQDLPKASTPERASRVLDAIGTELPETAKPLLGALAGNSPFLASIIQQHPDWFLRLYQDGPDVLYRAAYETLTDNISDRAEWMKTLRLSRKQVALAAAAADVSGYWSIQHLTQSLSGFADLAIQTSIQWILREAQQKGTIKLSANDSGILVLAMGKLGANELNYSSDIDLVILFDPERIEYRGRHSVQHFMNNVAQELSAILQERTRDGFVFRVDLRLRPDPRSTPLAVNINSAIAYYEGMGQNWERAAMIKARPVVADEAVEERFNNAMKRFIWRKHLDFAAIEDINSIKRQIDANHSGELELAGHNIKLGRGGIREIEFYAQTQQLVWGGRDPSLRTQSTIDTLQALHQANHIEANTLHTLTEAYWYLRRVEHHLQMIDDQQTHSIPEEPQAIDRLAIFLGYSDTQTFETDWRRQTEAVHTIYAQSMESSPPLSIDGNLVFTGVEADPNTLKTLKRLGFKHPETVSDLIQDWHRGNRRASRSLKARQILTECTPALLSALADTSHPDDAFLRFDAFIDRIPTGVQLFSLLHANPELLLLLSTILGSAPALGETLARNPSLLYPVLEGNFYETLPEKQALKDELLQQLETISDYEEALRLLRQFKQEKAFQAGIQYLKQQLDTAECLAFLSQLADVLCEQAYRIAIHEFEHTYGQMPGSQFAILGLGKLGSEELTFGSDLDLIFLYDSESIQSSDGDRSIDTPIYYQRFVSRLNQAFTLLTKEGELYELDLRLRPGGASSALAVYCQRFADYYKGEAWQVERLALTRARAIFATNAAFEAKLIGICTHALDEAGDGMATAILDLRQKIEKQHGTDDPWNVKYVRGGLMDLDLMAQHLRIHHAADFNQQLPLSTDAIFAIAIEHKHLSTEIGKALITHYCYQRELLHILRLCSIDGTITPTTSSSLRQLICRLMQRDTCDTIEAELIQAQSEVKSAFDDLVCDAG